MGNDATRAINISAALSGTGALNIGNGGAGTVSYTGSNNVFTGAMLVNGGVTLQVGSQSNLGGNPPAFNAAQLTLNNAALQPTASFAMTNANSGVTIGSGGAVVNLNAGYSLTVANPVTGPGGLTVYGSGALALNGANTFTGPITVVGSTLNVSGLASQGPITVISATLSGSGAIAGSTAIYGTLMPSTGGFSFSSTLNLESSALLVAPLTGNSTSAIASVTAAAANVSSGATVNIVLNAAGSTVDFSNSFWAAAHTWPLLTSPALTGSLALGSLSADTAGRSASWFGAFTLQQTGTAANLVWTPAAPWQQWQAVNFGANWNNAAVAGPNVATAGDGMPNLLKYALGLQPAVSYPGGTNIVTGTKSGGYLQLTVTKNPAATDVTLTIQASSDITNPANWSSSGTTIDQNTPSLLQAHDNTPMSAAPCEFMRLMITQP
jgi:autotransporter-associated beta strand protein